MDPSSASLDAARLRLAEVAATTSHDVKFTTSLEHVPKQLDLALVVTPAQCRADVVAAISARHEVGAWILEKLLAQSVQQVDQIENVLRRQSQVWVNTPRRLMGWHKAIRKQLLAHSQEDLQVRVSGGNWGLACNAIHFIDLVSWWTSAGVDGVDTRGLANWQPSKRSGFQEVFGTLVVNFDNDSTLKLSCIQSDAPLRIEVETLKGKWLIEEASGRAVGPFGQEIVGQIDFQSTLTAPLVEQILASGRSELPSLVDSAAQHRPFLDALLKHWNNSQSRQDLAVPIT